MDFAQSSLLGASRKTICPLNQPLNPFQHQKKENLQRSEIWQWQSKEKTKYVITDQSQRNLWFFYIPDNLLSKHMFKNLVFKLLNCVKVRNIWPKWIGGWYHIRLSYLESHQSHKSCVTFVSTVLTKWFDIDLISNAMLSHPYDKYLWSAYNCHDPQYNRRCAMIRDIWSVTERW